MLKSLKILSAASALALVAASAQAATLTVTNVSGEWTGWTGGTNVSASNVGDNPATLRWGTPSNAQSGYDFNATSSSGPHNADTDFNIGTFYHHNFPIGAGTAISSATLDVSFTFYLGNDSANTYTRTSSFVFDHWETGNTNNPCADGGTVGGGGVNAGGCADRVTASTNPNSSETFTLTEGGVEYEYVFDVTGFDVGEAFWTAEGQSNDAQLLGRFTLSENIAPVPLPAAAWMLLAGMGGLAAVSRRRRRS